MSDEQAWKNLEVRYDCTRVAINEIEDERLRRDFRDVVGGVEYGLDTGNIELANACIDRLVGLAHSLCRTIGGCAAVGIIAGLREDGCQTGVGALRLPGWQKGRFCDTTTGGTRGCKKGTGTCHSDSTGCISTFQDQYSAAYVWGVVLL